MEDIQSPPSWTNELLKREISDNFKESSYVSIDVPNSSPKVSVKKDPFKRPKDTYKSMPLPPDMAHLAIFYPGKVIYEWNNDNE